MEAKLGPLFVVDPTSPWHRQVVQLTLSDDRLAAIDPCKEPTQVYLLPGLVDLQAWTSYPQKPHETPQQLAKLAQQSGFTDVLLGGWEGWYEPEILAQLRQAIEESAVRFHLLASWAQPDGTLAPIESLRAEGAFGWALPPLWPVPWRSLYQALPYLRYLGGPIFLLPHWEGLPGEVGVPEAEELALTGWQGLPPETELLALHLIAALHRREGGSVVVGPLTTSQGYQLSTSLSLPCFTAATYLIASAEKLLTYDAFWKVHPPLRPASDQAILQAATLQREWVGLASGHIQLPLEEKQCEWATAKPGQATWPYALPLVWEALKTRYPEKWGLSRLVEVWAHRPRRLFGLPPARVEVGTPLAFTLVRLYETPQPLPPPWEDFTSTLEVVGLLTRSSDADSLQSQIL